MKYLRAVNPKDRLPEKEGNYFVIHEFNNFQATCYFNGKKFATVSNLLFWYEEVETNNLSILHQELFEAIRRLTGVMLVQSELGEIIHIVKEHEIE